MPPGNSTVPRAPLLVAGYDVTSAQQRQEGEVVPETVGLPFDDACQPLVTSVVPHLGVFAHTGGTLLILIKPGPEVGGHMTTLRALQVIFALNLDS